MKFLIVLLVFHFHVGITTSFFSYLHSSFSIKCTRGFLKRKLSASFLGNLKNSGAKQKGISQSWASSSDEADVEMPTASVHLKLGSIQTATDSVSSPSESYNLTLAKQYIMISEFRNTTDESLLLPMSGRNRTKLEIFSEHVFGYNLSTVSSFSFAEVSIP
jgi:hypothetical protein